MASPELSTGLSTSPEKKDSDDSKDKKKKSTGSAALRAEIVTETTGKSEPQSTTVVESIWQKIKGDGAKPKQPEMSLFGIKKPEADPKIHIPTQRTGEHDKDILDQTARPEATETKKDTLETENYEN